jgi:ubiquinone/menaquinone biosynthesis C-methylase UbiE/DNA-binding transcriptional ArsR family regulator
VFSNIATTIRRSANIRVHRRLCRENARQNQQLQSLMYVGNCRAALPLKYLTRHFAVVSFHADNRMEQVAKSESIVDWMGSLADPKRLRILQLLEATELGVAELCDILQSPQSTISRHLKVLGDLGWVRSRKQGTTHLYRTLLDELDPAARRLWLVARQQSDSWPAVTQDRMRLQRRLQQRTRDSQTFFAGAAGQWDKLRGELYGEHFSSAACLAMLPESQVVADLGCGTGQIAATLAPFVKQVIGVDNSAAMLKAAGRRLADVGNVELRRGELSALPIESAICDAALLVLALTYMPEAPPIFAEMSRILRPGGRAIVVDLLNHDRDDFRRQLGQRWAGFELEKIQQWLKEAPFDVTLCRALPTEPNVKGPALFLASAKRN